MENYEITIDDNKGVSAEFTCSCSRKIRLTAIYDGNFFRRDLKFCYECECGQLYAYKWRLRGVVEVEALKKPAPPIEDPLEDLVEDLGLILDDDDPNEYQPKFEDLDLDMEFDHKDPYDKE